MKLILWDIDGTLLDTGGVGAASLVHALAEVTGIQTPSLDVIDYRGRTDKWNVQELMRHFNLPRTDAFRHELLEAYLRRLQQDLPRLPGKVHPGILDILDAVRGRPDLVQGLLTGNIKKGAQFKLEHYNVWHYFEFGAFGDDSAVRDELGPFALARAKDRHNRDFKPEEVFIVGDTPHDIACAKAIGAHSIAVATGNTSLEELLACGPTVALPDLSDPAAFFTVIDSK